MKLGTIFAFCLLFSIAGLFGYFPLSFTGSVNPTPVLLSDEQIIHSFGTYHDEVFYHLQAQRLNSFDSNHKPITMRRYSGWSQDEWEYSFGYSYEYDELGRLTDLWTIAQSGSVVNLGREIEYYPGGGDISQINLEWLDGEPCHFYTYEYDALTNALDSVFVHYIDYGDSVLTTNMLNSFTTDDNGDLIHWTGRCYDYGSGIFSIGDFEYDEGDLVYFRFETPANREHVIYRGVLHWEDDFVTSFDHLGEDGGTVYGVSTYSYSVDGLLEQVVDQYYAYPNPSEDYTYEYDEHGRLISELQKSYNSDGTLNHMWRQEWEYSPWVGVGDEDIPQVSSSLRAWPNPFNPETTVGFNLAQPGVAELAVYNIRGERVATLANRSYEAGEHHVVWSAEGVASGVYFAQLRSGGEVVTTKLLLLQ